VMKSRDFTVHQAENDVRSNSPRKSSGEIGPRFDPTAPCKSGLALVLKGQL
jgi:hypothetical protein